MIKKIDIAGMLRRQLALDHDDVAIESDRSLQSSSALTVGYEITLPAGANAETAKTVTSACCSEKFLDAFETQVRGSNKPRYGGNVVQVQSDSVIGVPQGGNSSKT